MANKKQNRPAVHAQDPQNLERRRVSPEKFVSVYANDVQIQITPWDLRFVLGVIELPTTVTEDKILIHQVGEIRMSPQLAKRVADVLNSQLANYETNVGPIPMPPVAD